MKKYLEPLIIICLFDSEQIVTISGMKSLTTTIDGRKSENYGSKSSSEIQ